MLRPPAIICWLIQRTNTVDTTARLTSIGKVVSAMPVLEPRVLTLAETVAQHYASITSDVLRAAIPRRVAGVEQEIAQQVQEHNIPEPPTIDPPVAEPVSDNAAPQFRWELIDGAQHLFTSGHNEHYALTLPSAHGSWKQWMCWLMQHNAWQRINKLP